MTNIPTDLLRTLITVVDQRSFTRAARVLGVTQPAVSAHIKRLQTLLGNDLLDRTGSGFSLTPVGEVIVGHARRLLSINDLILSTAEPNLGAKTIHLGFPGDFLGGNLPGLIANVRKRWPDARFALQHGGLERHLNDMRQGRIDIAVGLSVAEPSMEARHQWPERMVWLRGRSLRLDPAKPVPLVALSENCIYYHVAADALKSAGRPSELVFLAPTIVSVAAALGAGLGVMALPRSRVWSSDMIIWENAPLPKLPDLTWAICVREGGDRGPLEDLADSIAAELQERSVAAAKPVTARAPKTPIVFTRTVLTQPPSGENRPRT